MAKKANRVARPVPARPVDPRAAAIAEADRLLWELDHRVLDDWEVAPRLREIGQTVGPRLFDELVNRIWAPDGQIRSSVVWALGILGESQTIPRLWQIVRTGHRSTAARHGAIEVLDRMGVRFQSGDVPQDLLEKLGLAGRPRLREAMAAVQEAQSPAEVETAMLPILHLSYGATDEERAKGQETSLGYILDLVRRGDRAAANVLSALAALSPVADLRLEAERALTIFRGRGVVPTAPAVLALRSQQFHKAYVQPVPGQPTLTQVVVAWERGEHRIKAFVFIIDVEQLRGGIRAFEATGDLEPAAFRRRFVEAGWLAGTPPREISLEEARRRVADALQASIRSGALPPEYVEHLPLIDRYLLAGAPAPAQTEAPA
ncbi:MAG: hypothetical protein HY331_06460 [Chloroflexi bacterium]|nr:hypothetical protein [Chloroflexota bacterium]